MVVDEQIKSEIRRITESGEAVELLNFYQGLPVTCPATFVEVQEDQVTLKTQPRRSVCLALEDQTWILTGPPLEAIHAQIASFDILNNIVRLTHLTLADSRLGKRMNARVTPRQPIEVVIQGSRGTLVEHLADISMTGIGLFLSDPLKRTLFSPNEAVFAIMRLPSGIVQIRGQIQAVTQTGGLNRLSIAFTEGGLAANLVSQYISDRRDEILNEIETLYTRIYQDTLAKLRP